MASRTHLKDYSAPLLDTHHDVAWFDVPVDEFLFVDRSQTGGDAASGRAGS